MVGLVLVSHSRNLAEAACRLAKGVGNQELPIAFAGGAGDDHQELGTDATDIMEAIQSVDNGDGVLVLMDLGSAVLSARMAEEMLADDVPNIKLCPAPLVEGGVAAAIQIGAGADIDAVYAEAKGALAAKIHDMSDGADEEAQPAGEQPAAEQIPADATHFRFTLDDPNGLHTRPAAALVKALAGVNAEVRIRNYLAASPFVNARSLNQIALSNIGGGGVAELALWGPEKDKALEAVKQLLRGDSPGKEVTEVVEVQGEPEPVETAKRHLAQLSPGVATGTLYMYGRESVVPQAHKADDAEKEVARLDAAVKAAGEKLRKLKEQAAGPEAAAVLDAQLLLLDDDDVLNQIRDAIRKEKLDADSVYHRKMTELADSYRKLDNAYMRERAADVGGVAEQVLDVLAGREAPDTAAMKDVIIYSAEVSPTQTGQWRHDQLKGILTGEGGVTSHVAIIARSLGIPALTGYVPPAGAADGDVTALDANKLQVVVKPSPAQVEDFAKRQTEWDEEQARDLVSGEGEAVSRDGYRIQVQANIGDIATAREAAKRGAEGVGLLRTEFLFLERRQPPTEEEQVEKLSAIFKVFGSEPITVRTLDIGGDKQLPWLKTAPEANPFLGVRGVRLALRNPDVFATQLRAILRAGAGHYLEIMFPMIATVTEVDACHDLLKRCHEELEKAGTAHAWPVRFGVMLETPAAALTADALAAKVDFFSIGSNDLTQYVLCAERGNRELAELSDAMHPAVLRAIRLVCTAARGHKVAVGVCGEMAADPVAARALLGLGVDHLSMNPTAVGRIKRTIRESDLSELRTLAEKALNASTAEETRALFILKK